MNSRQAQRTRDLELFISRKGAGVLSTTPEGQSLLHEIADAMVSITEERDGLRAALAVQPTNANANAVFPACHHRKFILREGGYECEQCGLAMSNTNANANAEGASR